MKRGDLTNNVLSVLVAVIGIGLLAFGIVKLYSVYNDDEDKNAQKTLDNIMSRIDNLENGQKGEILIQGFEGADNWYIAGWSESDSLDDKPGKCGIKSCLCVCRGEDAESCQERGYCEKVEQENVNVRTEFLVFDDPNNPEKLIVVDSVKMGDKLIKLPIEKKDNLLDIYYSWVDEQKKAGEPGV